MGRSSKEAADGVEKLVVPMWCDREGLISCTVALMAEVIKPLYHLAMTVTSRATMPPLQKGSLILQAGMGEGDELSLLPATASG